jgi:hypothetical protein
MKRNAIVLMMGSAQEDPSKDQYQVLLLRKNLSQEERETLCAKIIRAVEQINREEIREDIRQGREETEKGL